MSKKRQNRIGKQQSKRNGPVCNPGLMRAVVQTLGSSVCGSVGQNDSQKTLVRYGKGTEGWEKGGKHFIWELTGCQHTAQIAAVRGVDEVDKRVCLDSRNRDSASAGMHARHALAPTLFPFVDGDRLNIILF